MPREYGCVFAMNMPFKIMKKYVEIDENSGPRNGGSNTLIGGLFNVNYIDHDHYYDELIKRPTTPEEIFGNYIVSEYGFKPKLLCEICAKAGITKISGFLLAADSTLSSYVAPGTAIAIESGHAYFLGMFRNGALFGETPDEREAINSRWLPRSGGKRAPKFAGKRRPRFPDSGPDA